MFWEGNFMPMFRTFAAALAAIYSFALPAAAQQYPSQPIKIIVSLAPGGVADITARALARSSAKPATTVVVENRTGAAARSAPTRGEVAARRLHTSTWASTARSRSCRISPRMPYNAEKDFLPVVFVATSPNVLIVNPSVPAKTPQELVAYIKANPAS
jgi:tripartite-type tricarboxylate transporter receptor subunit TctC